MDNRRFFNDLSARGVRIGGSWFAYARENTTTNAALFAWYLLGHLKECGVGLSKVIFQTDSGSEYIGNPMKKGKSAFEKALEGFGVKHSLIPPSSPTWNSDVETFHGLIEDEFYDIEDYRDGGELIGKAWASGSITGGRTGGEVGRHHWRSFRRCPLGRYPLRSSTLLL